MTKQGANGTGGLVDLIASDDVSVTADAFIGDDAFISGNADIIRLCDIAPAGTPVNIIENL